MGPLQLLAPLVALSSAASAAFAAVGALLIVAAIGTPLVLTLLHTPMPTGLWRAPWAWCLFPLTAMVVCSEALRGGFTEGVLFPLGVLCTWLVVALLAAVPRLLFRVLRFSFSGKPSNVRGGFDRALGVLGLGAAVLGAGGALWVSRPAMLGLASAVAALSLWSLRAAPERAAWVPRLRLGWLVGTLLIAVAIPVLVVFTLAMLFSDVPLVTSNSIHPGVLIELGAVIAIVVGVIALRVDARGVPAVAPSAVGFSAARSA